MFFKVALYVSLAIFVLGLLYKLWTWFSYRVGPEAKGLSFGQRASAGFGAFFKTLFGPGIVPLLKGFILDGLLHVRLIKEDFLRWFMHMCMYGGFMLLLLIHALYVVGSPDQAWLNPYLFIRDLFGFLVIVGLIIAFSRRWAVKRLRQTTGHQDAYAIVILAVIMLSGILLASVKIISTPIFDRMVEEYARKIDDDEKKLLQAYWIKDFGLVSPGLNIDDLDEEALAKGKELHQDNCANCHDKTTWAFVSLPVARVLSSASSSLAASQADKWLWYIHWLACFIGLAYLPFSKFIHIIVSPISLAVKEVLENRKATPAGLANRRAMELDACTHCGTCSQHCSVAMSFQSIGNANILPSEKLAALKALAAGRQQDNGQKFDIQEGSFICTSCYRCTELCPVGINLQDLWLSMKEDLAAKGLPDSQTWARNVGAVRFKDQKETLVVDGEFIRARAALSTQAETFSACFECQTCSNVCPVVANYENPAANLDLAPHQIMHSLGLGLRRMTLRSRMIWDCLTCYQCQEHCPQGVKVTDVLYELKNAAYEQLREQSKESKS